MYLKNKLKIIAACGVITAQLLVSCQNSRRSQQQATGGQENGNENDSTVIHPVSDPNAVEGLNTVRYPNGIIKAKGYCSGGKKTGEWQAFYEDGLLWSDEHFTEGYPDGPVTVYYDSFGKKRYEGQYRMGKPVGIWKYMKQDGTLIRTANYDKKAFNTAM